MRFRVSELVLNDFSFAPDFIGSDNPLNVQQGHQVDDPWKERNFRCFLWGGVRPEVSLMNTLDIDMESKAKGVKALGA